MRAWITLGAIALVAAGCGSSSEGSLVRALHAGVPASLGAGDCGYTDGRIADAAEIADCRWRTGLLPFEVIGKVGARLATTGTLAGCFRTRAAYWAEGTSGSATIGVQAVDRPGGAGAVVHATAATGAKPKALHLPVTPAESCSREVLLAPELTLVACVRSWNGTFGREAREALAAHPATALVVAGAIGRLTRSTVPDCSIRIRTGSMALVFYSPKGAYGRRWNAPVSTRWLRPAALASFHVTATLKADGRLAPRGRIAPIATSHS